MTYYVSYLQPSGELIGVSNTPPPNIDNMYVAQYPELPNLESMVWDISSLSFITNSEHQILTKLDFLTRFTSVERINIRASIDPIIVDFMALLNLADNISLADQNTINGLSYLSYIGLLTPERVTEILR